VAWAHEEEQEVVLALRVQEAIVEKQTINQLLHFRTKHIETNSWWWWRWRWRRRRSRLDLDLGRDIGSFNELHIIR
jgi:hypothetical protein